MATISFKASRIPLIPALNHSVVLKNDGGSSVKFQNKAELLSYFEAKNLALANTVDYMSVTCQCGKTYDYPSRDDVPSSDVVCACGRNLILYG